MPLPQRAWEQVQQLASFLKRIALKVEDFAERDDAAAEIMFQTSAWLLAEAAACEVGQGRPLPVTEILHALHVYFLQPDIRRGVYYVGYGRGIRYRRGVIYCGRVGYGRGRVFF